MRIQDSLMFIGLFKTRLIPSQPEFLSQHEQIYLTGEAPNMKYLI
jgi:hypothetical protein